MNKLVIAIGKGGSTFNNIVQVQQKTGMQGISNNLPFCLSFSKFINS